MSYTKNTWQARTGTGLNKFTDQNGNPLILTPSPDSITQQGTPFSADWMNNIENGIEAVANPVTIPNGSDLNDYLNGYYCQLLSAQTSTIQNIPENRGFYLWAEYAQSLGTQRIFFYATGRMYWRVLLNNSWSAWTPINGDGVMEQGTSGIWKYKKYISGEAECWGVYAYTPASVSQLVTNWYYAYSTASDCPLPFTFLSLDVFMPSLSKSSGSACIVEGNVQTPATNRSNLQFLVVQANSAIKTQYINIYCRGTWR